MTEKDMKKEVVTTFGKPQSLDTVSRRKKGRVDKMGGSTHWISISTDRAPFWSPASETETERAHKPPTPF